MKRSENWVFLDSGDSGAIGNSVAVAKKLAEQTALPSRILFTGDFYFQERLLLREIDNLPEGVSFSHLGKEPKKTNGSAGLEKLVIEEPNFDTALKSWLFTLLGAVGSNLRPSFLKPIALVLQRKLCIRLLSSIQFFLESHSTQPVEVVIPNGRFPQEHALRSFFLKKGVKISFYEKSQYVDGAVFFQDYSIHDCGGWGRSFEAQKYSDADVAQAAQWFSSRQRPNSSSNKFAARFSENARNGKYDVAVFSSSYEEFMCLVPRRRGEWDSQYQAFETFLRRLHSVAEAPQRVAFRMHPNLATKVITQQLAEYSEALRLCRHFPSLDVFSPVDRIDSYSLLKSTNLVVVMQSTVGLESAFEGKQVVVLYEADYSQTVSVDNLFSKEEVTNWLPASSSQFSDSALRHVAKLVSRDLGLQQVKIEDSVIHPHYQSRRISDEFVRLSFVLLTRIPFVFGRLAAPILAYFASLAFRVCKLSRIQS